jgi:hypothetical protein
LYHLQQKKSRGYHGVSTELMGDGAVEVERAKM